MTAHDHCQRRAERYDKERRAALAKARQKRPSTNAPPY